MKNLISFDRQESISLIVFDFDGVFTDNCVMLDSSGYEYVRCSRYDGFGIAMLHSLGIKTCVITTETVPLARARCRKLGIECFDSVRDKLGFGLEYIQSRGLTPKQTAFVGNDINDLSLLKVVELPIVTNDAHPSVKIKDFYCTQRNGGQGCVREIADYFTSVRLC